MSKIKTLDDIRDLSITIVNNMIEQGLIKDCTDTEEMDEFEAQDIIVDELCKVFNIENY